MNGLGIASVVCWAVAVTLLNAALIYVSGPGFSNDRLTLTFQALAFAAVVWGTVLFAAAVV